MEEFRPREHTPAGKLDGSTAFEVEFLARLASGDRVASGEFYFHTHSVVWIWLKTNHPEVRLTRPEVERCAREIMRRAVRQLPPPDPQVFGRLLRSLCRDVVNERLAGHDFPDAPEFPFEEPGSGPAEWVSGGRQESVRRLLDELPPQDRSLLCQMLCRIFREDKSENTGDLSQHGVDGSYLRRLLFRARLRFRDLEFKEFQKKSGGEHPGLPSPDGRLAAPPSQA